MNAPNNKSGNTTPPAGLGQGQPGSDNTEGQVDQYETGYKKPPKHTQFQKGNKVGKGRPKGTKNLKTIVNEALGQKVSVKIGGKTKKLAKVELAVHQVATKASQGDPKASEMVIALYERYGPQEDPAGPPKEKLQKDFKSLEKYLAMKKFLHPDEEEEGDA